VDIRKLLRIASTISISSEGLTMPWSWYKSADQIRDDGECGPLMSDERGRLRVVATGGNADSNGLTWEATPFGDLIVGQRNDLVSANFVYGLPSQLVARIELWDKSGGAGTFTANETVSGGTSGATAIIETIVTPIRLRVIQGALTDGETITGVGITAAASGATCVITKTIAANGGCSVASSVALITAGTAATCVVALESKQFASYAAGHELGAFFTAAFDAAGVSADSTQFLGLSTRTGSDGYFVGYSGVTFGLLIRKAGITASFIAQTAWNIDKFDGTGLSGLTMALGPTLSIYHMKTGYLGVYGVVLCVMGTDGRLYPAHFYTLINAGTATTVADPHFVIRAEIVKSSGATTPQIRSGSWNAYGVGPPPGDGAPPRNAGFVCPSVSVTTGAERFLFAITNKLTYAGVNNNAPILLESVSIGCDANATNGAVIRIRRNAATVGTTQVDIDALNSSAASSITGTSGFTGGGVIFTAQAGYGGGAMNVDLHGQNLWIMPGESVAVTSESTSTQATRVGLHWCEGL
jgi:hypothetical protein